MPVGVGAELRSALLRDVADAEVGTHIRYLGFLSAAGFVFITGIPFEVGLAVSGAVLAAVLSSEEVSWLPGGTPVVTRLSVLRPGILNLKGWSPVKEKERQPASLTD